MHRTRAAQLSPRGLAGDEAEQVEDLSQNDLGSAVPGTPYIIFRSWVWCPRNYSVHNVSELGMVSPELRRNYAKTVGVRGHASGRRQHRAATEEPIITIICRRSPVGAPGRGVGRPILQCATAATYPDRAPTGEPTIIFQNRCWVSGPGVEFTGKGGEEPLSGEEGRAPPLECPAVRRPSAEPTWRDAVGSKIKFLGEGGAER